MEEIKYLKLTFNLNPLEDIFLPQYKGSTFRGAFGTALKKVVCTLKKELCENCILRGKCVYAYIFETIPPSQTKIMRRYKAVPHPFVIEPPVEEKSIYKENEKLPFNLILIGKATEYLPYFIYTFIEIGKVGIGRKKGKYKLNSVKCGRTKIYDIEENKVLSAPIKTMPIKLPKESETKKIERISLNFITPTRIISEEKITKEPNFNLLIRQLIRRISLISYFHCSIDTTKWDFKNIIEKAKDIETIKSQIQWFDWERYSNRQKRKMNMGGFKGTITFEGKISQFIPLLKIGEIIHIGKGTTFGLGKYEIVK